MESPTVYSQGTDGGDGVGDGRSSNIDAPPHEFEVEFPPAGPLGITFEWAVDSTALFSGGNGDTPVATPRAPSPLDSSTLPPIGSSPSSAPKDRAIHPTRLSSPPTPPPLPHSLRILSFPRLPPQETPRAGTITDDTGTNISTRDDESDPRDKTGRGDTGSLHQLPRASDDETQARREENPQSAADPQKGASSAGDETSSPSNIDRKTAGIEEQGGVQRFGPVAGRDVLRLGDILVEVNGNPVAGPAARDAGVLCFEDAVGVVAAAARIEELEGPGEEPRQRRRIFKFRREAPQQRLASPSSPQVLQGEWARERSGPASASKSPLSEGGAERDAPNITGSSEPGVTAAGPLAPKSSWSTLYPVLKLKGWGRGLAAGRLTVSNVARGANEEQGTGKRKLVSSNLPSSRSRASDASSTDMADLSAQFSWRSRGSTSSIGSDASFASSVSSKARGSSCRRKRGRERKGRNGTSVVSVTSTADRIKADARRGEALLEPLICPRQQRLKDLLERSATLRPLTVRLTNLSYWYQQRRLLGGSRHMHRRTAFDPRTKRWEASVYTLGSRPSDGKMVPILTPIKSVGKAVLTERQALAQAMKSAKERDANPGASRGPKPAGMTQYTMLQTHLSVLVVSEAFTGLSHADRLALVFTVLHDELAASSTPPPPPSATTVPSHGLSPRGSPQTFPFPTSTPTPAAASASEEPVAAAVEEGLKSNAVDGSSVDGRSSSRGYRPPRPPGDRSECESRGAEKGEGDGEETRNGERREGQVEKEKQRVEREGTGPESVGSVGSVGGDAGRGRERVREGNGGSSSVGTPPSAGEIPARTVTPAGDARTSPRFIGHAGRHDDEHRRKEKTVRQAQVPRQHRAIRGGVKASFVGPNVEALPIWGGLDAIAGSALLVDCRTPAQWRAEEYRPTAQELWGPGQSGHRTLANNPRVKEASVRSGMERIIAESKLLREAAPKFEHFDRFGEGDTGPTGGDGDDGASPAGPGSRNTASRETGSQPAARTKDGDDGDGFLSTLSRADGPNVAAAATIAANRKAGHTHPHFFHGLGPNARKLFMELYAENRSRLLAPISRNVTAGSTVSSTSSAGRNHPHSRHRPAEERVSAAAPPDGTSLPVPATARSGGSLQSSRPSPPQLRSPGASTPSVRGDSSSFSGGGGGGAAANVRHAAGAFAAAGPPPDLDVGIMDRYGVLLARLTEVVTRIQRVRRLGGLSRAARRLRRRQRAALAVQRVFRGHLGRRYASIWKVITALASTRLSAGWRRFKCRREFLVFRARARAGATGLQALFRGHVARRYAAWCAAHYSAARHIQRGARGFTARCHARRLRATRAFELCGLGAILLIQRVIRGFLVRQAYARRFKEAVRVRVIVPAAGVLQRCWRGKKGREEAALRRRMWAAAIEIQRHARGLSRRMWWARVLQCRLEHAMATTIAAVGRGYIDREIVKARRERRYFLHTITPACVLIQSQWRGYTKRRDLAKHKQRWLAALYIQVAYRGVVFRRKARRRYQAWLVRHKGVSATKIQCMFRKWRSQQLYRVRKVEASWRRTFATRIILRSWRSYKMNLAFDELKEQWRVEKTALELADAQADIQEIHGDLELCLADIAAVKKSIKKAKRRIKDLVEFRKEAGLRLPRVEQLIENLTVQDMAGGWGENYDREWDMLSNCMSMAIEEERIQRVKIAKLEQDLQILKLEIDDQEADLDASSSTEFDRMEALRRLEITRGLGLAKRDRTRAVRRERMRWAVRDVRRNVIKRSRKDLQRFRELARAERPLEVKQTISYEKRRDQERDEEAEVRRMEREARKERFMELKKKGEGSLAVREVYDAVVSGVRDILATASFDARRAKHDYRGRGPDEVGPAASAAATAAAAAARKVAIAVAGRRGGETQEDAAAVENAAAAAAAAAASAAGTVGGAEPGGGKVCRECGGPRFGRTVCAKCGANANSWRGLVESDGED